MSVLDEARAIVAGLEQPEPEPERRTADAEAPLADSADLFGEPSRESVPEQPVSVPLVLEQPEQPRDSEAPVSRDDRRREAARMVLESGLTVRRAANETGLSPSAVHRAVEAARRSGGISARTGTPGTPPDDDAELPPNFKTWGAVLRSYEAAQRKLHELAQQNAAIRSENDELREQLGEAVHMLAELKRRGVIA
jgi:transposase-like protein